MNFWEIPTPEIVAISVDKLILPDNLSHFNKVSYFENICFGSKFYDDAYELNEFISLQKTKDLTSVSNSYVLFLIALFDIWIENDDRKPTNNNILLSSKKEIIAIDHAFVFSSIPYTDIRPEYVSSSYNDTILHSPIGLSLIKKTKVNQAWLSEIKQNFYLCIKNCKDNYNEIVQTIPPELGFSQHLSNKIFDFLFNKDRNEQVFTAFISRLT